MKTPSIKYLFLGILLTVNAFAGLINAGQVEDIFTEIYEKKIWWTGESFSGCGSNLYQTQLIRQEIPKILKAFKIGSILDIPCGDFHWMKEVRLEISYIGADVVKSMIQENRKYETNTIKFEHLDLIQDNLPYADLILCRDCLVHLSYEQIWKALKNMKRSGAKYLLTTCHSRAVENSDILTAQWRPLNLMAAPFHFNAPLLIFNEGYEGDKCLMLWKFEDINV